MKKYLRMENKYGIRCLEEQAAEKALEGQVFKVLQGIPVEQDKIMLQLMDKMNESLRGVHSSALGLQALTDWATFEERYADQMAREEETNPTVLTAQNHPDETQFNESRVLQLDNLHIYHKLRNPDSSDKPKTGESLGAKLKRVATSTKHDYAARGTWIISVGGNLIEYDCKNHQLLTIFNLRKCRLSVLSQINPVSNKHSTTYCYFTLHGQKVHGRSDKKHRMKKDYKFRAPLGITQVLHQELSRFCLMEVKKRLGQKKKEEGEEKEQLVMEGCGGVSLSGDTASDIETPPLSLMSANTVGSMYAHGSVAG